jgi:hypothetical protein
MFEKLNKIKKKILSLFLGDEDFAIEIQSTIIEIEGISRLTQYILLCTTLLLFGAVLVGLAYLAVVFFNSLYATLGFEKMLTLVLFLGLFYQVLEA